MFAQAEKFDVLYYHHFVVGDAEGCAVQYMVDILMIAASEKLQRFLVPFRSLPQTFAFGIFADQANDFPDVRGNRAGVLRLCIQIVEQQFFRCGCRRLVTAWSSLNSLGT